MIKARPCAGDLAAGERFLREVSPFIWRKYLDYGAVADVHAMKRQMAAYKGHDEIAIEGHNIKLGRGGIREIEFFVQTQQLIAGGRHPELRGRETLATLDDLAEGRLDRQGRRARPRRGLPFPARHRASPADGRGRADPHAAGRAGGRRALRALPRLCRPRRLRGSAARAHAQGAAAIRAAVRGRAQGRGLAPRARLSARQGRHRDARQARRDGLSPSARSVGRGAALALGRIPLAEKRVRALAPCRSGAGADRPSGARGKSRPRAGRARPLPRRPARRRAAVVAAAAQSGPHRAARARARHGAAPRRHPRGASAGDGRADRAVVLRRAAGRRQARRRAVAAR